jgi:pimeloyl-ACP methyl ester carboxylesterase
VIGGSAGALSALEFALRHPARCSALVPLVPAAFVPGRPETPASVPWAAGLLERALSSDFLFWAALKSMPDALIATALATDPALLGPASAAERERVRRILWNILPVSERAAGLILDAKLARFPRRMPLATMRVPTLAVSVRDDRFGTFAAAEHIAATVPGARLLAFERGGHVWVGHDEEVSTAVHEFVRSAA